MSAAVSRPGRVEAGPPSDGRPRHRGAKLTAYLALTKPRVIELLLVTTAPVMILAARGIPDLGLVLATLVGGAMSAGSANAFNQYLDRDIDRLMHRTGRRPLVTGEISDRGALVFAWALGVVSIVWLGLLANWLAAALSLAAILVYVFVYTLWLKRRTEQNIIWGGIAGCFPVLIGWAAVTGSLDWAPFILFAVVFLWTPPHYWPLSMKYRDDYDRASVPMLAVVRGGSVVGLQTVLYAWATVAASLLLIPIAPMGVLYGLAAALSGTWFVVEAHRLYAASVAGREVKPMRVFHASITYLTLLFVAVGVDPLLYLPIPL
ncbi:MAG: heme o synthase [Actinomycetales bacterium]|nr:heme o synthase [Actinomycetales bacterium]